MISPPSSVHSIPKFVIDTNKLLLLLATTASYYYYSLLATSYYTNPGLLLPPADAPGRRAARQRSMMVDGARPHDHEDAPGGQPLPQRIIILLCIASISYILLTS